MSGQQHPRAVVRCDVMTLCCLVKQQAAAAQRRHRQAAAHGLLLSHHVVPVLHHYHLGSLLRVCNILKQTRGRGGGGGAETSCVSESGHKERGTHKLYVVLECNGLVLELSRYQ